MLHELTQEELARKVGTSHSQISRIESGLHRTSFSTLLRVARALHMKMLVGFEGSDREGPLREVVAL
jgi:transcriptional regulator with XRE-family HTH domain